MGIKLEPVMEYFALMAKLEPDACYPYRDLAESCIEEVAGRLRPDTDTAKHGKLLAQMAAASAYYRYIVMNSMVSGNVSALDLSVSIDNSKQILAARRLRDEFMVMGKGLLCDDHFLFGGV